MVVRRAVLSLQLGLPFTSCVAVVHHVTPPSLSPLICKMGESTSTCFLGKARANCEIHKSLQQREEAVSYCLSNPEKERSHASSSSLTELLMTCKMLLIEG